MEIGKPLPCGRRRDSNRLALSGPQAIRVLIVDDHAVVRAGFGSVCQEAGLTVAGLARNEEELHRLLQERAVDVLLLDSRIEQAIEIVQADPSVRVVALSNGEPDERACSMVEAGAIGFLLKDSSRSQIVETIEAVYFGDKCLPPWIRSRISERKARPSLSQRELEVLGMVSKGLTNKEIAHVISVSHFTVRNHVRRIIDKLDVSDRTEAATLAIQQGILTQYGAC